MSCSKFCVMFNYLPIKWSPTSRGVVFEFMEFRVQGFHRGGAWLRENLRKRISQNLKFKDLRLFCNITIVEKSILVYISQSLLYFLWIPLKKSINKSSGFVWISFKIISESVTQFCRISFKICNKSQCPLPLSLCHLFKKIAS